MHGYKDNPKEDSGVCKESSARSTNFDSIKLYIEGNPIINDTALMSIPSGNIKWGSKKLFLVFKKHKFECMNIKHF